MIINQDPGYAQTIKDISKDMSDNYVQSLTLGRTGLMNYWLQVARMTINLGPKSEEILTKDLNTTMDNLFGISF